MSIDPCWGEWLLDRAADGLPYPDEVEPMPEDNEETDDE